MGRMEKDEIFKDILEPYDRLVTINIRGAAEQVPENNTILRGLQYLDMEHISEADLCWNGECLDCQVWVQNGEKEKAALACRTTVFDGMVVTRVSECLE